MTNKCIESLTRERFISHYKSHHYACSNDNPQYLNSCITIRLFLLSTCLLPFPYSLLIFLLHFILCLFVCCLFVSFFELPPSRFLHFPPIFTALLPLSLKGIPFLLLSSTSTSIFYSDISPSNSLLHFYILTFLPLTPFFISIF